MSFLLGGPQNNSPYISGPRPEKVSRASYGRYPDQPSPLGYIVHMTPFILFPGRKTIKIKSAV